MSESSEENDIEDTFDDDDNDKVFILWNSI
jgi:hypothetical protein